MLQTGDILWLPSSRRRDLKNRLSNEPQRFSVFARPRKEQATGVNLRCFFSTSTSLIYRPWSTPAAAGGGLPRLASCTARTRVAVAGAGCRHENAQPRGICCTRIDSVSWFDAITKKVGGDGDGGFRNDRRAHLQLRVNCPRRPLLESNASTRTHNHAGFSHMCRLG